MENYKSSKGTGSEQRKWKHFKWTRNRAKKLLKRKLENHKKAAIKEIEELRVENPRLYWKKLKEINGKKKKKDVWDTALNEEGEEVTGEKIKLVWKEAYKKLGELNLDKEEFDNDFAEEVDEEVEEMIKKSHEYKDELGEQITLAEVQKIVKRLKKGKAAGQHSDSLPPSTPLSHHHSPYHHHHHTPFT